MNYSKYIGKQVTVTYWPHAVKDWQITLTGVFTCCMVTGGEDVLLLTVPGNVTRFVQTRYIVDFKCDMLSPEEFLGALIEE